jgi:hypothetical protein
MFRFTRFLLPAAACATVTGGFTGCSSGAQSARVRDSASLPARDLAAVAESLLQAPADSLDSGRVAAGADASVASRARPARPNDDPSLRVRPPLLPTPDPLRGLYVNRWAAIGTRIYDLIAVAKRTEVNALVIDVKDDRGFVLYPSRVSLAHEIGADAQNDTVLAMPVRRIRAILDTMRADGIYPIARIVVAKDPLLAEQKSEWSVHRKSDGKPWLDKAGKPWLDPHNDGIWDYAADLAIEATDLGFSEVQFDYVRFPDDKQLIREAQFPLANGRVRAEVIAEEITRVRQRLDSAGVRMTIDVFGLTTSDTTDMGIGQRWEMLVGEVDAVLPMMYPSHYAPGTYGFASPNAHPFGIIDHVLKDAKRRSEGIANAAPVIPWYQDFTLGPPHYGATQVREQMRAGYENGIESWILWNPRSDYTVDALEPAPPM